MSFFTKRSNQEKDDDDGEQHGPGPKRRFLFLDGVASAAMNAFLLVGRQNAAADLTVLSRDFIFRHRLVPAISWRQANPPA